MKTSLSHFIALILIILMTVLLFFINIQFNIRNKILVNNLDEINYLDEAYNNIILKIEQSIVNEEIKEKYKKYVTKDIISKDLYKIIVDKETNITHFDEFYKIIEEYTEDKTICEKYSSIVDNIYISNIFPVYEYRLMNTLYINTNNVYIYSLITILIVIILQLFLCAINRNLYFNKITILSVGIIQTLPFLLLWVTHVLKDFIYTNNYYTKFFLIIINNIKNYSLIFGILVILIYSFYSLTNYLNK